MRQPIPYSLHISPPVNHDPLHSRAEKVWESAAFLDYMYVLRNGEGREEMAAFQSTKSQDGFALCRAGGGGRAALSLSCSVRKESLHPPSFLPLFVSLRVREMEVDEKNYSIEQKV